MAIDKLSVGTHFSGVVSFLCRFFFYLEVAQLFRIWPRVRPPSYHILICFNKTIVDVIPQLCDELLGSNKAGSSR